MLLLKNVGKLVNPLRAVLTVEVWLHCRVLQVWRGRPFLTWMSELWCWRRRREAIWKW